MLHLLLCVCLGGAPSFGLGLGLGIGIAVVIAAIALVAIVILCLLQRRTHTVPRTSVRDGKNLLDTSRKKGKGQRTHKENLVFNLLGLEKSPIESPYEF